MRTDEEVIETYIDSISTSRQLLTSVLSLLTQQETTFQTIINNRALREEHIVPLRQVWQSRFARHSRAQIPIPPLPPLHTRTPPPPPQPQPPQPQPPHPTVDISLNDTEDMLFSNIPENDRYDSCPITHEDFTSGSEITRLCRCGHYFNRQAIAIWMTTSNCCPICRAIIRTPDNNETYNNSVLDQLIALLSRETENENNSSFVVQFENDNLINR